MLLRYILLAITLLILCTLMRLWMISEYLPTSIQSEHWNDFQAMWLMGFKLDMRAIGIAMLGYLALYYISILAGILITFFQRTKNFTTTILSTYAFLLGFVFMFAGIVNFYYFRTYETKIDAFIFGFKDDDTLAILEILWKSYPVFLGILSCLSCGILTFAIHTFTRKSIRFSLSVLGGHIVLILSLIIAARGSLGTFPIREDNHFISPIPIFNHIATNPIIAFGWALSNYKNQDTFATPDHQKGESLQNDLFPLMHNTPHSEFLAQNPPHIVLTLLESFGSNMLVYDSAQNDLLGSLRVHFESDFVFKRFLSSADGTAGSFAALFFESPTPSISLGSVKNISLPYNPFKIYADSGYEVIYITSGYASWQELGAFIKTQGAHHVYDAFTLMQRYPQSSKDKNTYGVPDEYAYKLAFEILLKATKPTFISILTTSNHPPYHLLSTYTPKPLTPPDALQKSTQKTLEEIIIFSSLYQYANDAFGQFISQIKNSPLAQNTIIAASGDHKLRDLQTHPTTDQALSHAVPFYLYIPNSYRAHIHYDPARVGSHKDILPTLYELSLSNVAYMSLGGRNILASVSNQNYNFGFNNAVWIDDQGIYPIPGHLGYLWANDLLHSTSTTFEPNAQKVLFASKYLELWKYAIALRIIQGNKNYQLLK